MALLSPLALFLASFFILIKGADVLIRGTSSIAKLFGLSSWFIGMVIVGIGTSIPEFSINVASALGGDQIGVAAIMGSNVFNTFIILGVAAIIFPLTLRREWVVRDLPLNIAAVLAAIGVILFPSTHGGGMLGIDRLEGLILVALLCGWIFYMLRRGSVKDDDADAEVFSWTTSVLFILFGFVGVFLGGYWVVGSAGAIAEFFGVSHAFIGFTIVAIGTSLPELVVSMVAAFKKQTSIAVGGIIGSGIFNFLGVLGFTALISPIVIRESLTFDIYVVLLTKVVLLLSILFVGKRFTLSRVEGFGFVLLYIAYVVFLFLRG